jgi:hypothetical protein
MLINSIPNSFKRKQTVRIKMEISKNKLHVCVFLLLIKLDTSYSYNGQRGKTNKEKSRAFFLPCISEILYLISMQIIIIIKIMIDEGDKKNV